MDLVLPATLESIKDQTWPCPEEVTYWEARQNRTFYIDYEIDENYDLIELSKIIIQMNMAEKDIDKKDLKPIYLWVFSYGGSLDQAYSFIDLCMSSRIPIITINMGVAMSAGLLILLAGHKRYGFKHSQAMIHSGSAGFSGTAEQIEQAQKSYKKQLEQMKQYIISRTKITENLFEENRTKDWYLSDEEQVSYGVVNKIIESFDEIFE